MPKSAKSARASVAIGACVCGAVRIEIDVPAFWAWHDHSKASQRARLITSDLETLRLHYAFTLRDWLKRATKARKQIEAMYDERFFRMWEFYLAGAEMDFRYLNAIVFQLQLAKRIDAVPLTRDYITEWEAQGRKSAEIRAA